MVNLKIKRSEILEKALKNTKTKIYPDGSVNTIYCNRYIFKDKKVLEEYSEQLREFDEQDELFFEMFSDYSEEELEERKQSREVKKKPASERERSDSLKRSKDKVFDIARLNDWKYFLTITFDGSEYDFNNPDFVKKKVNKWLKNEVQRQGLKYLLIPEYHEKGGIHCHALINSALDVTDSGTVIVAGYPKPVKRENALKFGSDILHTVYNVPKWKYGFSTAIEITDTTGFAYYITKYITKGNDKIFGKYYWAGGDINREPEIVLTNTDFSSVDRPVHHLLYTANSYKYNSNFEVDDFEAVSARFEHDFNSILEYLYSEDYRNEVDK